MSCDVMVVCMAFTIRPVTDYNALVSRQWRTLQDSAAVSWSHERGFTTKGSAIANFKLKPWV